MEAQRAQFGDRLKQERVARSLSLPELARLTKIPQRTLERLEEGRFEELPAEVFVRGFVKSYAKAVGLDPDGEARRYGELLGKAAPTPTQESVLAAQGQKTQKTQKSEKAAPRQLARPPVKPAAPAIVVEDRTAAPAPAPAPVAAKPETQTDALKVVSRALLEAGRETRRMPLTLAVIILVIVATLTMSLLLDPPAQNSGTGVTQAKSVPAQRA